MIDTSLELGKTGTITGVLTSILGILWCLGLISIFKPDLIVLISRISYVPFNFYQLLSLVIFVLLILSGAQIGFGYFGIYKVTEQSTGLRATIFTILGTFGAALFIVLSGTIPFNLPLVIFDLFLNVPVYPNLLFIDFTFLMLAFTLIYSGRTLITIRESTGRPNLSIATAIISIISGTIFTIPMILSWIEFWLQQFPLPILIIKLLTYYDIISLLGIIAFTLMLAHLLMLSSVFQSTKELA